MRQEKRALEVFSAGARFAALLAVAFGLAGCGGDDGGGPGPDTTAPVITAGPSTSGLTTAKTTIQWTTNEASTSIVRYGPSADSLDAHMVSLDDLVTSHAVVLTAGLTPDDSVHYQVSSTDGTGSNTVTSGIAAFLPPHARIAFAPDTTHTTLAAGSVTAGMTVGSVTDLFGAAVTVLFDNALVRCDSITTGLFLAAGGDTVIAASHIDNPAGEASIGLTRIASSEGNDGSGVLALFHFTPLAQGTSALTIRTSDLVFLATDGDTMPNFSGLVVDDGAITIAP